MAFRPSSRNARREQQDLSDSGSDNEEEVSCARLPAMSCPITQILPKARGVPVNEDEDGVSDDEPLEVLVGSRLLQTRDTLSSSAAVGKARPASAKGMKLNVWGGSLSSPKSSLSKGQVILRRPAVADQPVLKTWKSLTKVIWIHILECLDHQSVVNIAKTCRACNQLTLEPKVWRTLHARYFVGTSATNQDEAFAISSEHRDWKLSFKTRYRLGRKHDFDGASSMDWGDLHMQYRNTFHTGYGGKASSFPLPHLQLTAKPGRTLLTPLPNLAVACAAE
ncbi:hypothetical protein CYMTET_18172 [Cymbomonas tetramitiformis]|uniref:F-box domain-containing protein n=1 Tax=Cymbomonas tetramitiformis TaxID=36881 RepID=A0AAE0G8T0_9CHLO|nr:hypothetical protein CYMTET_18172 [Cymbomonas tetramitiformis]